ncbi:MAG: aminodeoxychorismate lyase [Lachnospiraceae bacterium]|nr:aminodeoxychorismate lyase [Lachnospiraceae bacterium]
MSVKSIIGSTVELIIKVVALVFIASYIIKAATAAYDYGYRIFTEAPVSLGEGRVISVIVEEPVSVKDIGKMLEERGLIRDANLFVIQELLSEDHGKIQPGIYDLSTSMTAQEMMAVMAADAPEEDEENAE